MKIFSVLIFYIFLSSTTFAQQEINTTFKNQMNTTFGNLDKNRIPHGILLDYGMEFTNVPAYDGTLTDSTYTDIMTMSQIYKTLLTSRIRDVSEGFVTPIDYETRWKSNRNSNNIVIGGLFFKYVQVVDNAVATNKINVINGIAYDKFIGGVWQNPYQEFQTFAMTPAIKKHEGLNMEIRVPSAIFYSNYQNTIQSIQIDFDNGAGYVTIPFDQNFAVNYTSEGVKIWKYKLNLTNGISLYNHSRIKVVEGLNTIPYNSLTSMAMPASTTTTTTATLYSHTISGTKLYSGATATVKLTIDLGAGHTQITKPLIVAEGFDLGVILNPENIYGMNNYNSFITSAFEGGNDLRSLITGNSLTLPNDQQYDIIYVDWNNGVDYMQRNAFALEEVIKWINTVKVGTEKNVVLGQSMGGVIARYALADMEQDGLDHKTRLFVSHDVPHQGANIPVSIQFMYRHLTNQYVQTNTTIFGGIITVPILENDYGISNYISILDTPATKQLLSNWSNFNYSIDNNVHQTFYNDLKTKGLANSGGYPVNCRNISISNGSECGLLQNFNPNDDLVNFNWNKNLTFGGDLLSLVYMPLGGAVNGLFIDNDFFGVQALGSLPGKSKFNVEFNAKAMPYGSGNQIYKGRVSYTKKILWIGPNITVDITNVTKNQPAGILPLDTYGGGYYNTSIISNTLSVSDLYVRDKFNFIPTTSALDIGKRNIALQDFDYKMAYIGGTPPVAPKSSPFANFCTDFDKNNPNTHNKQHISFNTRNGKWLEKELSNTPITTNCSFICNDAKINGTDNFCSSSNYSVSNAATTYNWSITSTSNLAVISSGQGTNAVVLSVVNPNLNGFITLSCYLGNFECGYTTISKRIHVGRPTVENFIPIQGAYSWVARGYANTHSVYIAPIEATTSYRWEITMDNEDFTNYSCTGVSNPSFAKFNNNGSTVTPTTSATYTSNLPNADINWGRCSGSYILTLTAINECGETEVTGKYVTVGKPEDNPCNNSETFETSMITAAPNPVEEDETIVINVAPNYEPCDLTFTSGEIGATNKEVVIYDLQGNQKYNNSLPIENEKININNHGLKKGHYIMHVKSPNGHIKKGHIIIKKTN